MGDNVNGCTTFSTNGSTQGHFGYYRFYDFRNVRALATGQNTSSELSVLPVIKIVSNASWTDDWDNRVQSKAAANANAIQIQYSSSNVNIAPTLHQNTPPISHYQPAGEIDYTQTNLSHASIRVLARVSGAPGAVAGIFTYYNDTTESDIEILTRDPGNYMHYSNQPTTTDSGATLPGSTWNISMPPGRTSNSKAVVCSVDQVVGTPMVAKGAMSSWAYSRVMMWIALFLATCMSFV